MKKIILIISVTILLLPTYLSAQEEETKINFYDGEFFLVEEEYRDALFAFKKVYDAGYQDNANVNYRIGVCYLNLPGEKEKAISYLNKAATDLTDNYREGTIKENQAPHDALLYLGNAYRINNQLDKAISSYKEYVSLLNESRTEEINYAKQQIEACNRAKKAIEDPVQIKIENLGVNYNTGLNNFNAVKSFNNEVMAFMSEQRFYNAVYFVQNLPTGWSNPVNITPQIQSDGDQYVSSLSYDGKTMFLVKASSFDGDIMISHYESRTWSKSENIGKPINSKYFESHACLSPDGNTLYFTSNRKESLGGMDIFFSTKDEDGEWTEPVNMGSTINTSLNEESPFISADGNTLYFSSQGHETIGGFDVFYSTRNTDGSWTKPIGLPYPMNTTDDDLFFFPLEDVNSGYMARYEPNGFGGADIYRVKLLPEKDLAEEQIILEETEESVEEVVEATEQIEELTEETTEEIKESLKTESETEEVSEEMVPVTPTARYYIKPIFFKFDSYALTDIAKKKLNDIVDVMDEFNKIALEVRGHTDAIGTESYNQLLSERRAKTVIQYLTDKGIDSERLEYKGFSESRPVARNRTPEGFDAPKGRQLNRRVEFRIIRNPVENVLIDEIEVPQDLELDE